MRKKSHFLGLVALIFSLHLACSDEKQTTVLDGVEAPLNIPAPSLINTPSYPEPLNGATSPNVPAGSPNILFIYTDDQSPYSINAYREAYPHLAEMYDGYTVNTPAIDQLASEGVLLSNVRHQGATAQAICVASRSIVFSGGLNLWENSPGGGPGTPRSVSLGGLNRRIEAEGLQIYNDGLLGRMEAANYETFFTGKTGAGYISAYPTEFPFVDFMVPNNSRNATTNQAIADDTINYLEGWKTRDNDKPFFATLSHPFPHEPRVPESARQANYLSNPTVQRADWNTTVDFNFSLQPPAWPNYIGGQNDADYPFFPLEIQLTYVTEEERSSFPLRSRHSEVISWNQAREHALVESMDFHLERIFQWLKDEGEYDNTIIIYTSDHGIAMGQHGLLSKQSLYDHSLRVPMIIRGPGVEVNQIREGQFYLHDISASILDWGGASADHLDGDDAVSMVDYLAGDTDDARPLTWHRYTGGSGGDGAPTNSPFFTGVISDYQIAQPNPRGDGRDSHVHQVAIVKGDWKLITTYRGPNATATNSVGAGKTAAGNPAIVREELFDLSVNPWELLPIATTPTVADVGLENPMVLVDMRAERDLQLRIHDDPWFSFPDLIPSLSLHQNPDNSIKTINSFGQLQYSDDLIVWNDAPNPTKNIWFNDFLFFRVRYKLP